MRISSQFILLSISNCFHCYLYNYIYICVDNKSSSLNSLLICHEHQCLLTYHEHQHCLFTVTSIAFFLSQTSIAYSYITNIAFFLSQTSIASSYVTNINAFSHITNIILIASSHITDVNNFFTCHKHR